MESIPTNLAPAVLILGLLTLTACGRNQGTSPREENDGTTSTQPDHMDDDYGLTAKIQGDHSLERTWVEPEVEKITTLTKGEDFTLYNPFPYGITNDRIYVFDAGDYTIKAFTPTGKHVATYGRGKGRGPGEFTTPAHVGVHRDSLVYVVDFRQRRISFFEREGDFVRTESSEIPLFRVVWTNGTTKYLLIRPLRNTPLMIIESSGRRKVIAQISSQDIHPIALQGDLHAHGKRAVFVPDYLPVILTYSPNDTTGVALPTPDYGYPRPKAERTETGVSAPDWSFNLRSTLSEGVLSVGRGNPNADSLLFDLYDLQDMTYMHTLRLPIQGQKPRFANESLYAHGLEVVVAPRDTAVELYKVNLPKE